MTSLCTDAQERVFEQTCEQKKFESTLAGEIFELVSKMLRIFADACGKRMIQADGCKISLCV